MSRSWLPPILLLLPALCCMADHVLTFGRPQDLGAGTYSAFSLSTIYYPPSTRNELMISVGSNVLQSADGKSWVRLPHPLLPELCLVAPAGSTPYAFAHPPPRPCSASLPLLTQQGSTGLTTPFSVLTAMAAQSTPSPAGNPPLHSFGNTEAKYQRQATPFTSFSGTGPVFYRVSAQGRFTAVADQSRNVTFSALPRPIGCIQTTCCNCPFRVDSGNTVRLADDSLLLVMNVFYQPKTGARRERESARACERETGRQGDRDRDRETESGGHTQRDTERERVCTA